MASYKNQHFVPKCYLKPFTLRGEGRAINLYNIDRRGGVRNAPVKNQCSKDYFYGKDLRLEHLLREEEGLYARILEEIRQPGFRLEDGYKVQLRRFCYLQNRRTEAASQQAATFFSEVNDIAYGEDTPAGWRATMQDAVLTGMKIFVETMHLLDDLKVCLIRNRTKVPFITSDDPAVLCNRWYLHDRRAKGMSGGVGSAGVLFFLPLTPDVLCVLYDGDVYSIEREGGWVEAVKPSDIQAFNEHQFLACLANIYFADWEHLPLVDEAFAAVEMNRPSARHKVTVAVLDSENDWGQRFKVVPRSEFKSQREGMIHLQSIQPSPSQWPSMIRWRAGKKIYSNGSGTGYVRRWSIESGEYRGQGYRRIPSG